MKNVRIKVIESYHPKNKVSNEFFLNYYDNINVDVRGLLNTSGRQDRYLSNNANENAENNQNQNSNKHQEVTYEKHYPQHHSSHHPSDF